jgi:hypothetical protein
VVLRSEDLRYYKPHRSVFEARCAPAAARQETRLGSLAFMLIGILLISLGSPGA